MTASKETKSTQKVKRRQVFYIPGYDPFPPRRYRELYRKESQVQAAISGYSIEVKGKPSGEKFGWRISSQIEKRQVDTDFEVLIWSDIVRESMANDVFHTYLQLLKTAWIYISSGTLFRLMRLRKGPIIAALYPVFALTLQLFLAIAGGAFLGTVAVWIHPWLFWITACVTTVLILRWFKGKDSKFFAYYLMNDFAHSAKLKGAFPDEILERLDAFRRQIETSLTSDVDEVLVVGHSSGAHLAIHVLADIVRRQSHLNGKKKLAFLSLGHVVPMVSFLPKSNGLRADLQLLSAQKEIAWIDVTAPGDGCSFALCDPVDVTGVSTADKRWPLCFSAAFTQSLSPERWRELRWRFFRLHFQYLCAFDRPKDYDYFKITAGPLTLVQRYANRPASKSVLRKPLSRYRDIT